MKFAHIADVHLGAFRIRELRELNLQAFLAALEKCMEEEVDFLIIAGDLFHNPIPDTDIVLQAARALKNLKESGIEVFVTYGSHDFTVKKASMLDILAETGLVKKAMRYEVEEGRIKLLPVRCGDVEIYAMPGLHGGVEAEYFEHLTVPESDLPGIFVFHSTIREFKPPWWGEEGVPLSLIPDGFSYYAGGHIHKRIEARKGEAPLIYPGPLFGSNYTDLEHGEPRGFYIVEDFAPRFVEVHVADVVKYDYDATGKTPTEVMDDLLRIASRDHGGAVVLLRIYGKLASGRPSDVKVGRIRERFLETARTVQVNRAGLTGAEEIHLAVSGETDEEVMEKMLAEIADDYGLEFVKTLYSTLSSEKQEGMSKADFREHLLHEVMDLLERAMRPEKEERKEEKKGERGGRMATLDDFLGGGAR